MEGITIRSGGPLAARASPGVGEGTGVAVEVEAGVGGSMVPVLSEAEGLTTDVGVRVVTAGSISGSISQTKVATKSGVGVLIVGVGVLVDVGGAVAVGDAIGVAIATATKESDFA
jgi:hypothetical protein